MVGFLRGLGCAGAILIIAGCTTPDGGTYDSASMNPDAAMQDATTPDAAMQDATTQDASMQDAAPGDAADIADGSSDVTEGDSGTADSGEPEPPSNTSCPPHAAVMDPVPAGAYFVDPDMGDDANVGSESSPWRTLDHALEQLRAGDTLVLRGGRYRERNLQMRASGTPDAPITIRAYPGERPSIESHLDLGAWELVDDSIDLYRTVQNDLGSDVGAGKFRFGSEYYTLAAYSNAGSGRVNGMDDLRSTEHRVSSGPRYVGPGFMFDGGHVYVRLTPSPAASLHGRNFGFPTNPDPAANELYITDDSSVLTIRGNHIVVSGLELSFGRHGIYLTSEAHHVRIEHCTVNVPAIAIYIYDGCHDIEVDQISVLGSFAPWIAWSDMKGSDGQSQPASHWNQRTSGVNGSNINNIEIANSCFDRVFDGHVMTAIEHLNIHHNTYVVLDDMVQLGTDASFVEIHHNRTLGPGPSHYGQGNPTAPGTKYVHHNILDTRIDMLWGRADPLGLLRFNYSGWHGNIALPTHTSSAIGDGDPWKIYHNTVVQNGRDMRGGMGFEMWTTTNSTGVPHEVYNNIFVETEGGVLVQDFSTQGGPQIYDGNLYFQMRTTSTDMFDDIEDSSGTHGYASLAELRASPAVAESMVFFIGGWEANGVEGDPQLDEDFRPSASGPASADAIALPSGLPGGGEVYRGALPPRQP